MSDESGKDSEEFSEISDMGSDSDEEEGVLMSREAVPDTSIHTKNKVSLVGVNEVNLSGIENKEKALGMSPYEMFRQRNIKERQQMFQDTFREIDELRNSLMNKKKTPAPRHNQAHETYVKRRSERIVVQESRKELLGQKSQEEQENPAQKVVQQPSEDPLVSFDLVDLVKVKCEVCGQVMVDNKMINHCRLGEGK